MFGIKKWIELLGRQRGKGTQSRWKQMKYEGFPNVWFFVGMNGELHRSGGQKYSEKTNNLLRIAHGGVKLLQQPLILFLTSEVGVV